MNDQHAKPMLVVGADSMIGSSLYHYWKSRNVPVLGTSRRNKFQDYIPLDLEDNTEAWSGPKGINCVIFCAGVTKLEDCERDPISSGLINVTANRCIATYYAKLGVPLFFLSTNQVFDGKKPHQGPFAKHCPLTEYGRQKSYIDTIFQSHFSKMTNVTVLRLAKVMSTKQNIIKDWIQGDRQNVPIIAATNLMIAPVSIIFITQIIAKLIASREIGVYQISANSEVSIHDFASCVIERFNLKRSRLIGLTAEKLNVRPIFVRKHTTLNSDRLMGFLSRSQLTVSETLDDLEHEFLCEKLKDEISQLEAKI